MVHGGIMKIRLTYLKILVLALAINMVNPAHCSFAPIRNFIQENGPSLLVFCALATALVALSSTTPPDMSSKQEDEKQNIPEIVKEPKITLFDISKFSPEQERIIRQHLDDKDQENWKVEYMLIYNPKTGCILDITHQIMVVIKKQEKKKLTCTRFDFSGVSTNNQTLSSDQLKKDGAYQRMVESHRKELKNIYDEILK